MAHGGIAFLHRIVVTVPPTAPDADDLVVAAEVVDAQGDVLTRPWQHHVDSLRSGIPLVVDHPAIRLDARQRLKDCMAVEPRIYRTGRDILYDCDLRASTPGAASGGEAGPVRRIA